MFRGEKGSRKRVPDINVNDAHVICCCSMLWGHNSWLLAWITGIRPEVPQESNCIHGHNKKLRMLEADSKGFPA